MRTNDIIWSDNSVQLKGSVDLARLLGNLFCDEENDECKMQILEAETNLLLAKMATEGYKKGTWYTSYSSKNLEKPYYYLDSERDAICYLLLAYYLECDNEKLTEECKHIARGMLLSHVDVDWSKINIAVVAGKFVHRRITSKFDDLDFDCESCFEPLSNYLWFSHQFVNSKEEFVVRTCYALAMAHGCVSAYDCKISIFNSGSNEKQREDVEKYHSILLDFSCWNMEIGKLVTIINNSKQKVADDGCMVLMFSMDEQLFRDTDSFFSSIVKNAVHIDKLDTIIVDHLSNKYILVWKPSKTDDKVHIYIDNTTRRSRKTEILLAELNRADLSAINYNLDKIVCIPTIHAKEGERYFNLSEFLIPCYGQRTSDTHGRVFQKKDLAKSASSYMVEPEMLSDMPVNEDFVKVAKPVFVVGSVKNLQVAYVNASEEMPVYFRRPQRANYVSGVDLCEDIPYMLTYETSAEVIDCKYLYVLAANGSLSELVHPYIRTMSYPHDDECNEYGECGISWEKHFLDIPSMISIPSDKQVQIDSFEKIVAKEQAAFEEGVFDRYRKDIHERKHALGQIMFNLQTNWDALLIAKDSNNGVLADDMVFGKKNPRTVKDFVGAISAYIKDMGTGIENFTPEDDVRFAKKQHIDLNDFIQKYVAKYTNPAYSFEYSNDGKQYDVVFSEAALLEIIHNIVFNAWRHGFGERTEGNKIKFDLSEDETYVYLNVSNNGKPLDISAEKIFRYGVSSKRSKSCDGGHIHLGLGCYRIKCLMQDKRQGDVECIENDDNDYSVTFRLKFTKN